MVICWPSTQRPAYDDQELEAEQQALGEVELDPEDSSPIGGRDHLGIAVAPAILAHRLVAVKLDRPDRPDRFEQIGLLVGPGEDLLLGPAAERRVEGEADPQIEEGRDDHERRQKRADQGHDRAW